MSAGCVRCGGPFDGRPWEYDRHTGQRAHVNCHQAAPKPSSHPSPTPHYRTRTARYDGWCVFGNDPIEARSTIARCPNTGTWGHAHCIDALTPRERFSAVGIDPTAALPTERTPRQRRGPAVTNPGDVSPVRIIDPNGEVRYEQPYTTKRAERIVANGQRQPRAWDERHSKRGGGRDVR